MPELPDVEVFKQYLDATSLHQKIKRASVRSKKVLRRASKSAVERRLAGKRFQATQRHGKYLFVRVDKDGWLILHFGMTGFLKYYKNGSQQPPHARLLVDFADGYQLAFDDQRMLGRVDWTKDPSEYARVQGLGPDAFDLSPSEFREAISDSRAAVKSALMDQSRIAGVGNMYSDEILFAAAIQPQVKANRLSEPSTKRLYKAMKKVLHKAIECRADPSRLPRSYLLVHRGEDDKCPRCGRKSKRTKISGRTAYYCAKDQSKHP